MSKIGIYFSTLLLSLAAVLMTGCGGGSGDSGAAAQTGQVSVVFTDGPTDEYERILISLTRMTLIGAGGQQMVYDSDRDSDGDPITFDLLQLRDRADFAFSQRVAVGDYNKIRLEVSEIQLIDLGVIDDPDDDVEITLEKLPADGHIDLNPRGPFTIFADRSTVVELDIDARRSFQAVETGNLELRLRPVIFVNVYDDEIVLPNRMTRVFGTVASVDADTLSLVLCDLQFVAQLGSNPVTNDDACVRVFGEGANYFDATGMPIEFSDLETIVDETPETKLTAIGFPSLPDEMLDSVVLELDAIVADVGPRKTDSESGWETTTGAIVSELTMDDCSADQCIDFLPAEEVSALTVQLQPTTRVFTRAGAELAQDNLGTGITGAFDGIRVAVGDTEEMRASLFITGPDAGGELVSGTLTTVMIGDTFDTLGILLEGDVAFNVCVTSDTDVLQVLVNSEAVVIVDLLDPELLDPTAGLQIEAAGAPGVDANCDMDANVVIIE